MERILLREFKGRVPRIAPKLLPDTHAQIAINCDLRSGNIKPFFDLKQGAVVTTDSISAHPIDTELFTSLLDCDFVDHDVAGEPTLIVSDGTTYPKQYTDALYPANHMRLGVVPPATALTLTFGTIPDVGTVEINHTVSYVYTYVTSWGEESAPSPASAVIEVNDDQYITLTNFDITDVANKNDVVGMRIYRLAIGTAGAEYQFLEEIDDLDTTYDDYDVSGKDLNSVTADILETEDWVQPPADLAGIIRYANGMLAGFSGNSLYLSETFIVYAWPLKYVLDFDSDIVSIGAYNEAIIVVTETKPYVVTGNSPINMMVTPINVQQGGLAKRGGVETNLGYIYPSPDGLMLIDGSSGTNITKEIITKEQWAALDIDDLISFWYDDMYFAFFAGTDLGFTLIDGTWVDLDLDGAVVEGGYVSAEDDKLYLIIDRTTFYLEAFNDHATVELVWEWKSKLFNFTYPANFSCAKIYAKNFGSINFELYGDSVKLLDVDITTQSMFRLPGLSRYWDVEVYLQSAGNAEILESVAVGVSPAHLIMQ
jgi:hypothetical protein